MARFEVLAFVRDRSQDLHVFDDALLSQLANDADLAASRHDTQREALETCLQNLTTQQRELVLQAYALGRFEIPRSDHGEITTQVNQQITCRSELSQSSWRFVRMHI